MGKPQVNLFLLCVPEENFYHNIFTKNSPVKYAYDKMDLQCDKKPLFDILLNLIILLPLASHIFITVL